MVRLVYDWLIVVLFNLMEEIRISDQSVRKIDGSSYGGSPWLMFEIYRQLNMKLVTDWWSTQF